MEAPLTQTRIPGPGEACVNSPPSQIPFANNTVVLASAGTGKTRSLVSAHLQLLDEDVEPLRIVAVTFTEKAAAELRDRVRDGIYQRLLLADPSTKQRWTRILGVLPAAPVSTIHGFCSLLLREHGLAAGIDPSFSIILEDAAKDLRQASIIETVRREVRAGNPEVERLFGDFGLDGLAAAVDAAILWLNSLGADEAWLDERCRRQSEEAARLHRVHDADIARFGPDLESIADQRDALEAKKATYSKHLKRNLNALMPVAGQIAGAPVAAAFSHLVTLCRASFRMRKRERNVTDFDDLLLITRDLLRDRIEIRRHYNRRFAALLVDEFQDTDEVQSQIIAYLAEDPENEGRLAKRKLFIVGDPKQSIYRFRRARVSVFFHMMDRIVREGGEVQHLGVNYRSAEPLLHFANAVSASVLDGKGKPGIALSDVDFTYRVRFTPEDALRPAPDKTVPFLEAVYLVAGENHKAEDGRKAEAAALATMLLEWKAQRRIESWSEVVFLFRARSHVPIYARELEGSGIPVYLVQGTGFFQRTEVSDLIAVLEYVIRPQDPIARLMVLTSSLVGMPFRDLIGKEKNIPEPLPEILGLWIERRDRATAAEILEDVVRRTNYDVVMMAQPGGRQRVANIGKLIEMTREQARQGTAALDEIVRFLRGRAADTRSQEPEAQIAGEDDDVVRFYTVHQAKGLEFTIVVVPDLGGRPGGGGGESRTFHSETWGVLVAPSYGIHRKPMPHALIDAAKELDADQEYEEEKRLLYVAVTRAKHALVLGEGFSRKSGGPWLKWIRNLINDHDPTALTSVREKGKVSVRFSKCVLRLQTAAALQRPQRLLEFSPSVPAALPESRIRTLQFSSLELTPSDLETLSSCFRYFHFTRVLNLEEPSDRGGGPSRDAATLGLEAHRILETGSLPPKGELVRRGLADLAAVGESNEWQLLQMLSPEREMDFVVHIPVDGRACYVRGRMDVLIRSAIPRVIDYKYAVWKPEQERRYETQMIAYSLALMKSYDAERAVSEVWFLREPMTIIRRGHDRCEAERIVSVLFQRYIETLNGGDWPRAERAYCDQISCGFRRQCWGPPGRPAA